jgi:hypothetical protein
VTAVFDVPVMVMYFLALMHPSTTRLPLSGSYAMENMSRIEAVFDSGKRRGVDR